LHASAISSFTETISRPVSEDVSFCCFLSIPRSMHLVILRCSGSHMTGAQDKYCTTSLLLGGTLTNELVVLIILLILL